MADTINLSQDTIEKLSKSLRGQTSASNFGAAATGAETAAIRGNVNSLKDTVTGAMASGKALYNAADEQVNIFRKTSDIGLAFNNDALGLRSSIGQTRLGVDEYGAVISRAMVGFTALGGSITDSAKVFNRMSKDFGDSTAADQLRVMGYTTQETNEVLALSLSGRRNLDMNDARSRQEAIVATAQLAEEMDKTAKLTGTSRREQMDLLQAQQKDARLQAALELEIRKGGAGARDEFNKMAVSLKAVGLDKLGTALYTERGLDEGEATQMAALGNAGTMLQRAILETKNARTPEEKAAAEANLNAAKAEVAARTQSTEFLQATATVSGKIGESFGQLYLGSRAYGDALAKIEKETGKTGDAAKRELDQRIKFEQEGKDAQGKFIAGANNTAAVIQAQNRLKDSTVTLYQTLDAINQRFGKSAPVQEVLQAAANRKIDPATGKNEASSERGGVLPRAITELPKAIEEGTVLKQLPAIIGSSIKETFSQGLSALKIIGAETLNVGVIKEAAPKVQGFSKGTMGELGTLFGNFGSGTPAMLHGKEAVITESQMSNLFGGIQTQLNSQMNSTSMPDMDMFNGVQSKLKGQLDSVKSSMPDAGMFEKMFSQMKMPDIGEISNAVASKIPQPSSVGSSDTMSAMASGIDQLNMRIERLITAVEDGSSKSVRALKSQGNMIA